MNEEITWYEKFIEKSIRPHVKLLRENGFNTYASCGHRMYISGTCLSARELDNLQDILVNAGYNNYKLNYTQERINGIIIHDFELKFPLKDGTYSVIGGRLPDGFEFMSFPKSHIIEGSDEWLIEFIEDEITPESILEYKKQRNLEAGENIFNI